MKPIFIQTKNLQNQPERTLNENLNYICCKINNLIDSYNKKLRINTKYSRINRPTSNKSTTVPTVFFIRLSPSTRRKQLIQQFLGLLTQE